MYHEDTHAVQPSSGGGFAMGLMFGTLVGVAAALMFAPFAGSETRERLRGQAERFKNRTSEAYDRFSKTVDDTVKKAGQAYSEMTEQVSRTEPIRPDYHS